jgi:NitT/TauT family transport system substrate-binding protein
MGNAEIMSSMGGSIMTHVSLKKLIVAGVATVLASSCAFAEDTIRAAQQYGLSSLPMMVMEDQKLVEKHGEAAGHPVTVNWVQLGGPGAMNEAIISGDLDFGTAGIPSIITLWDRTKDSRNEIRGVAAVVEMPMDLVSDKENIKSLKDFTDNDKIAVTTIKVSNQALLLQMAAAAEFGKEQYEKLDPLTVSLPHPEAMSTLMSGSNVISAHFSAMPFQFQQLRDPKIHTVISSYDILGGPATNIASFTTKKFRDESPEAYAAFLAGLNEAVEYINKDRKGAAETYKRMANSKESIDDLVAMLSDPRVAVTTTPRQTMKMAEFMHDIGRIKNKPSDWKELFFEEVHTLDGS